jgi:hypothetical protein
MANRTALTKTAIDPIMGLFNDYETAARAYQALFNYGYTRKEITLGMSDEARQLHFSLAEPEVVDKTLEGLIAGLVIGAGAGAVAGVIAGIGTSLIAPGLGLVIAGWLAGGLVGIGAGGVAGGLIGALVGSGIVEEKVNEEIGKGHILIAVIPHSKTEATRIESEWLDRGSKEVIRQ